MFSNTKSIQSENIFRKAEITDAPLIMSLLLKNLNENLSDEERKNGFLLQILFHFFQ